MSKSTDAASKKRKGAAEPAETKKRTKVTAAAPVKEKAPAKASKTEITSISSRNALAAKKAKDTKAAKPAKKAVADDFAGFSDSEDEPLADNAATLLAGFSSDDDSETEAPAAITTIPALPESADLQTQLSAAARNPDAQPGTIYIGRIPHGFYESQMRAYFSQFGEISRLRLSRNKLTGKPKHYGYIEFASGGVADIVARTMDKYLMFGHILQVRKLSEDEVHPELYKGANTRFKAMPRNKLERGQLEKPRDKEVWDKRVRKEERRRSAKAKALAELGYEFDMPAVKGVDTVKGVAPPVQEPVAELEEAEEVEEPAAVEEAPEPVVEEQTETADKRKKGKKEKKGGAKKARLSV